ncbi:MAG: peptidoglycan editing factor PgeF [Aestuariivirga sp.]
MIESPDLKYPGITHGFFGRRGGASQGIFASLNCGLGSGDDRATVMHNRAVVAKALDGSEPQIVTTFQVHSAQALIVSKPWPYDERPKVDGMVTKVPGLILGTLTADCGPVLFVDSSARVIGCAHAGWKGALMGITDSTIVKMEELGAKRENIVAVLGPTISKSAYEVGQEFIERFVEAAAANRIYFTDSVKPGHYMFDLPKYLIDRLKAFGVGAAVDTALCTYTREAEFFSYRRATHRGEKDYGRQIAAITLI